MTKEQRNQIRLIKELANDLNSEKPNFKTTLDALELYAGSLKKSMGIDTPTRDTIAMWDGTDGTVFCNEDFYRKDLNVNSTCGRNKGHKGDHSWYNDTVYNLRHVD